MRQVRFGSLADVRASSAHVRFTPKSGHVQRRARCLLSATSGFWPYSIWHVLELLEVERLLALKTALGKHFEHGVDAFRIIQAADLDDDRRDHASFWDAGLPALIVTDTAFFRNPNYLFPATRSILLIGHSVRALARSTAIIPIENASLDKVSGNALDPDAIRNVLRDIDVVIQTLGVSLCPTRGDPPAWTVTLASGKIAAHPCLRRSPNARPPHQDYSGPLHPHRDRTAQAAEPDCYGALDAEPRCGRQRADGAQRPLLCAARKRRAHRLGSDASRAGRSGLYLDARHSQRRSDRGVEMRDGRGSCRRRPHRAPTLACRSDLAPILPARRRVAGGTLSHKAERAGLHRERLRADPYPSRA